MATVEAVVRSARKLLAEAGVATAAVDARMLAGEVLALDAAGLIARGLDPVGTDAQDRIAALVARRIAGEPVGRILGRREFHGLTFVLGPDTLEPRPDTETLVDLAISRVRQGLVPGAEPDGVGLLFADIGTGSGAIAIALAAALPGAKGIATDVSTGALAVAHDNAERLGVGQRLEFREGSYLAPVDETLGLVVSNPPYIASAVIEELSTEVRAFDPRIALDGGADGLRAYCALIADIGRVLRPGGTFAVEIGFDQGNAVRSLFIEAGLVDVAVHADLSGLDRVVAGRQPDGSMVVPDEADRKRQ
ncbi:peptide chain release factor N(5)-glutamine methyltransferase [Chthonobacter albigriseus]|uniref:peptide chain release factor N(5)-glutamine methyltransferase n=1 Tax=Chthonobacter albigriseus TaxID=1683161 RepID=UPI003140A9CA